MSIQAEDNSTDSLPSAPLFATRKKDLTGSENKPLGRVYYEDSDENAPLLSQSASALTNRSWLPLVAV